MLPSWTPLAFGFASPWLLLGACLATIPVVLHLLFRRQHREEPFAANRFLAEAARKHSRRLRFQHWLLLVVRMAILLLVAFSLARPFVEALPGDLDSDGTAVHHILIIDSSLSMRHTAGGSRRFDRGRAILEKIVTAAREGDTFRLLTIRAARPPVIIGQAAGRKPDVLAELERLQPTWEAADVVTALQSTLSLLDARELSEHQRVSLVSDLQPTDWQPEGESVRSRIHTLLAAIASKADLVVYDVGGSAAANSTIVDLQSDSPVAVTGIPVVLRATVKHFGTSGAGERQIELHVDDRLVSRRPISVAAGRSIDFEWSHRFATGGEHRVEARLGGDGLADDNRRFLSLPVRDRLQVLLVGGRYVGRPEDAATFYLETALAPDPDPARPGLVEATTIPERRLATEDLGRYDCLVLSDIGRLVRSEADRLARFVADGGGLILGLGDTVDPGSWNQQLGNTSAGLLPGRLDRIVEASDSTSGAFVFDPGNYTHPVLGEFRGLADNGLATTVTIRYLRTRPHPGSNVALAFDSGDPAILTRRMGHGRVVLVTTSLDDRWTTWPVLSASYLPMVHELIRFAVSGRWSARQRQVGEPIFRRVDATTSAGTLTGPDGSSHSLDPTTPRERTARARRAGAGHPEKRDEESVREIASDETLVPGIYRLELGPPSRVIELFSVNIDPAESDLSASSPGPPPTDLLSGIDVPIRVRWQPGDVPVLSDHPGNPLSRRALAILLGLLMVELIMAWRFRVGTICLAVLVMAALAGWWGGWLSGGVVGLLAGGLFAARDWRNRYGRHRRAAQTHGQP